MQYNSGLGEYTYGLNDYIYTYGSTPAYGYTQLPFTQGGRMKGSAFYADDTYQLGRATMNLGLRFDTSKGYFVPQDCSMRMATRPASSRRRGQVFRWNVAVAAPRRHLQAERQRVVGGEGATTAATIAASSPGEFDNTTPSITPRYLFSGLYDASGVPLDKELVTDTSRS